ncbi:PcfJ domain-containing protein [Leptospira ilyithenensis]|uniref:Uncharacterized protein n=1 Tax=Leptospira ilyithenensis TaxID=2484901 RepID=A0A4R9LTH6_9LEPT|nr:PcfJ domain-containing protein [Leptospira ilyithenensis]TGN10463.1 hypothetical protein EHS11_09230 [Leptospira ilyithenensis]
MIPALAFCLEHPELILSSVPEDFAKARENLPFHKRKKIAVYFGFLPSSVNVLGKITETAILEGYLPAFRKLYRISIYQKAFHHLVFLNRFLFDFFGLAQKRGWKEKWDILFLKDLSFRFPDSSSKNNKYQSVFQTYEEVKRFCPEWKVHSLAHLYELEKKMIYLIGKNEFTGHDEIYPSPPTEGENWMIPVGTRKQLFDESKAQHNCVFSYDSDILAGKYYIYRILIPERCTLSLLRINGDWYLDQVSSAFNKKVKKETAEKIELWRMQNGILILGDVFRIGIPPNWVFTR